VGQGTEDSNVVTFRETSCRDAVPPNDPCLADGSCINLYRCWDHGDLTIALTTTTYSIRTGIIYDADIELNAAPHLDGTTFLFTTVDQPPCPIDMQTPNCVATDVQNTITHEFGHAMGFDHTLYPGSTMNPTAPIGETSKRIIDLGTAQGFCNVYPKGLPPLSCDETGSLQRMIIADNRGTPGLQAIGCSSAGGLPFALLALLSPWLLRRRKP
jgi:MYXO-CTERM domain-containing protein